MCTDDAANLPGLGGEGRYKGTQQWFPWTFVPSVMREKMGHRGAVRLPS